MRPQKGVTLKSMNKFDTCPSSRTSKIDSPKIGSHENMMGLHGQEVKLSLIRGPASVYAGGLSAVCTCPTQKFGGGMGPGGEGPGEWTLLLDP